MYKKWILIISKQGKIVGTSAKLILSGSYFNLYQKSKNKRILWE